MSLPVSCKIVPQNTCLLKGKCTASHWILAYAILLAKGHLVSVSSSFSLSALLDMRKKTSLPPTKLDAYYLLTRLEQPVEKASNRVDEGERSTPADPRKVNTIG